MEPREPAQVTAWLDDWRAGDTAARDRLAAVLYPELRELAAQMFRRERGDHTLQPTALVNEAWLRLAGRAPETTGGRRELMAIGARLMREILIDHARTRARAKRDRGERVTLSGLEQPAAAIDLLDLDTALARLERIDPVKARVVELRYFGGLDIEETAQAIDVSAATVKRHWQAARLWLRDALAGIEKTP